MIMTFLDGDNGWTGGQDQTIDDVPGSIWKRSGSASAAVEKPQPRSAAGRASSPASGKLRPPDLQLNPMPRDSRLTNKQKQNCMVLNATNPLVFPRAHRLRIASTRACLAKVESTRNGPSFANAGEQR
jgi:hypothetical protein